MNKLHFQEHCLTTVQLFLDGYDRVDLTLRRLQGVTTPNWLEVRATIHRLKKTKLRYEAEFYSVVSVLKEFCCYEEASESSKVQWRQIEAQAPISELVRFLLRAAKEKRTIEEVFARLPKPEEACPGDHITDLSHLFFGHN